MLRNQTIATWWTIKRVGSAGGKVSWTALRYGETAVPKPTQKPHSEHGPLESSLVHTQHHPHVVLEPIRQPKCLPRRRLSAVRKKTFRFVLWLAPLYNRFILTCWVVGTSGPRGKLTANASVGTRIDRMSRASLFSELHASSPPSMTPLCTLPICLAAKQSPV